ncbi:MAG TPA: SpoIIE family protein phosphatase, partial [Streptosporangiaceae bacterium]|nr:SpoIIE family protein phosphatase [Streptosporangiaceae bacterium]
MNSDRRQAGTPQSGREPGRRPARARQAAPAKGPARRPPAGRAAAAGRGPGPEPPARQGPGTDPGQEPAALTSRAAELRLAAALPEAELRPILDAALAEVEAAADALARQREAAGGRGPAAAGQAERRLLHAVFLQVPVPVFLLGQDRSIRRANAAAARLLGSAPGYATGKQFTALVDGPDRARVQTQLADAFRTGRPRTLGCRLLGVAGVLEAGLTLQLAGLRGDADQLIVAVSGTPASPAADLAAQPDGAEPGESADLTLIRQLTSRLDLGADSARLLLEHVTAGESALVQRFVRVLTGQLAGWVIADIERGGRLRRQFVTGPDSPEAGELARQVADVAPAPGSAPFEVHAAAGSQLITHAEDTDALGADAAGMPLVMLLGAASVLSVPLPDGERSYGALTLVRQAHEGHFAMADVAVAEAAGEQLALAIRAGRMFRQLSGVADAYRASLIPPALPPVPGVEIASAHVPTEGPDAGGDFYAVYPVPGGTGLAIGDVCGTARAAVAVTSAARHAIRVLAGRERDPVRVLRGANEVLLGEQLSGEFVTAHVASLSWDDGRLVIELGSAGQPAPVLLTADGEVRQLRGGGQPLGIFPDAEPAAQRLELEPGDTLLLYS